MVGTPFVSSTTIYMMTVKLSYASLNSEGNSGHDRRIYVQQYERDLVATAASGDVVDRVVASSASLCAKVLSGTRATRFGLSLSMIYASAFTKNGVCILEA